MVGRFGAAGGLLLQREGEQRREHGDGEARGPRGGSSARGHIPVGPPSPPAGGTRAPQPPACATEVPATSTDPSAGTRGTGVPTPGEVRGCAGGTDGELQVLPQKPQAADSPPDRGVSHLGGTGTFRKAQPELRIQPWGQETTPCPLRRAAGQGREPPLAPGSLLKWILLPGHTWRNAGGDACRPRRDLRRG